MDDAPILTGREQNSLFYYPTARSLIIRGTHRYHSASTLKLKKAEAMAALPFKRPDGAPF